MHLSLNNDRIDNAPTVMHGGILHKGYVACCGVNLDNCAVYAARETPMWRAIESARLQAWTATFLRQGWTRTRAGQLHRHQLTRILPIGIAQGIGGDCHL